jgi:hypothetical protein
MAGELNLVTDGVADATGVPIKKLIDDSPDGTVIIAASAAVPSGDSYTIQVAYNSGDTWIDLMDNSATAFALTPSQPMITVKLSRNILVRIDPATVTSPFAGNVFIG